MLFIDTVTVFHLSLIHIYSIIEDSKETRTQAILELNNGLIDDVQYYIDVYKMTEKQAIEFRDKIKKRTPEEPLEEEPPEGA